LATGSHCAAEWNNHVIHYTNPVVILAVPKKYTYNNQNSETKDDLRPQGSNYMLKDRCGKLDYS